LLGIYVNKKWLESIGSAAQLLVVHTDPDGKYALMIAAEKNLVVSPEFVTANVCRAPAIVTQKTRSFILARIPTNAISAIFDLTEDDFKKLAS
jgi:hypothetical protein